MNNHSTESEITWIDGEITLIGRYESEDGILEIIAEWKKPINNLNSHWQLTWQFRTLHDGFHELGSLIVLGHSPQASKGEILAVAEKMLAEVRLRSMPFQQQKVSIEAVVI